MPVAPYSPTNSTCLLLRSNEWESRTSCWPLRVAVPLYTDSSLSKNPIISPCVRPLRPPNNLWSQDSQAKSQTVMPFLKPGKSVVVVVVWPWAGKVDGAASTVDHISTDEA